MDRISVAVVERIRDIPARAWDACANPAPSVYDPFVSHDFLLALEQSGCVGDASGWTPRHLVATDPQGAIRAVAPCYLKGHSYGEYVFDHAWAQAYEQAGGRYYPKLQCASPFTPVTGRRLLSAATGAERERLEGALLERALKLMGEQRASSLHLTFLTEDEWCRHGGRREGGREGRPTFLQRTDRQFQWRNDGYDSFDAFLATLSSRKRKAMRRERREALAAGVAIDWLTGSDITEAHWDAFYTFYLDTGSRKWGHPYLNRRFFSLIGAAMASRILLVMCRRGGRYVGGALSFIGGDALYGRYWGAVEHHDFLHFEACYYQSIDYAIVHGLPRVEAGAQGEHKLARGYLPQTTYSLHHLADPRLQAAVARYLALERPAVEEEIGDLLRCSPFRRDESPQGGP